MLEWFWFSTLTLIALIASKRGYSPDKANREGATFENYIAFAALLLALVAQYPVLGLPLSDVLDDWLPQGGTAIHEITVYVIELLLAFGYSVVIYGWPVAWATLTAPKPEKFSSFGHSGSSLA